MSHELDTYLGGILAPDILQPCQFYPSAKLSPESRLMFAVLEDALRTLAGRSKPGTQIARVVEDEHWMAIRGDDSPFSFESICSALSIDADKLRLRAPMLQHSPILARKRSGNCSKDGGRQLTISGRRHYRKEG